ncbi:hypothetical protein N7466_005689 [Penicillium verhagenii]|uniref:uncharacterized protein n=1 Tax=Penicillium verhagenii TaxID=1562060 RepID=UPI0025457844|nr:uncharacterized protein N7466_005689 [Penicillium verhagenii]KAJ5930196.1 hypothetical protein N7466_005689 [Penicillium verhagenii]
MKDPDPKNQEKNSIPKFGSFKLPSSTTDTVDTANHRPRRDSDRTDHTKSRSSRRSDRSLHERSSGRQSRSRSPTLQQVRKYPESAASKTSSTQRRDRQSRSRHSHRDLSKDRRHSRQRAESNEHILSSRKRLPNKHDLPTEQIRSTESSGIQHGLLPDRNNLAVGTPTWAQVSTTTKDSSLDSSVEFVLDTKGVGNTVCVTGDHWNPQRYRRFGGGFVLGLGRTHRIERGQSYEDDIVLRPCTIADSSIKGREDRLFAGEDKNLSGGHLLPPPEYRIHGSAANLLQPDEDFVFIDGEDLVPSDTEQTTEQVDVDAESKTRNATLWKEVENKPQDIDAWLKFIDHQDILILGSKEDSHCFTRDERTSLADVKLSLYRKALTSASNSPHRDRLLLGRLQAGAQLWDSEKLLTQWEKTLLENPEFISLWVKFLDFCQTDSPNFTFGECVATHEKYLRHVSSLIPLRPKMVQVLVYIFLRLTLLFREAGYNEIAVGLWQAVLEFCCFKPESLVDSDEILSSFRQFWDSEAPRIGEDGAKGWSNNTSSGPDPTTTNYSSNVQFPPDVASWIEAERERITESQLPWRSLDGSTPNVDDPLKVTLFCDIDHILPLFCNLTQSDELLDGFLYFSQLPHLTFPSNIQTTRVWGWDNLLRNEFVADHRLGLSSWIPPRDEETKKPPKPFHYPLQNFLHTTETLFASPDTWFYSFQWWEKSRSFKPPLKAHQLALRALRALVDRHSDDDELVEYALALEFAFDPAIGKKSAKKIVKKRPSCLRLWNALALMESRSEGDESKNKANGIWATALSMSSGFTQPEGKVDRVILWQSWIWHFVERGDMAQALYLLHHITDEKVDPEQIPSQSTFFNPTATVKIQKFLRECQEKALAARRAQAYVAYTDCLGLTFYVGKWPFLCSLDVYDNAVLQLKQLAEDQEAFKAFTAELLHQARARVIYNCMCKKEQIYSPMEFRALCQESITLFPHNTIFQSMCMWNEFNIIQLDRLRDVYKMTKGGMDSQYQQGNASSPVIPPQLVPISSYLLPIWIELVSPRPNGPVNWNVRPAFERALGEVLDPASFRGGVAVRSRFGVDSARSNLTIWKLYMLYERYHAKDLQAAKAVLFRAIRACPWSKELIMFAFEHLRDGMPVSSGVDTLNGDGLKDDELRRLILVIDERQLRLHINPLDE